MSRPKMRKETTLLDISMIDERQSNHSKPVMKTENDESKPTLAADIQELFAFNGSMVFTILIPVAF